MKSIADLVLESATDYAIITTDLEGRISYWSAGAGLILGWTSEEAIGCSISMIFVPEDKAHAVPSVEQHTALTHGRSVDERWYIRKDGAEFWAIGELLPLSDAGTTTGFLKILRDRTPQKRAEDLQLLLTQELNHRIKNMVAVVQSIVDQSFRHAEDANIARTAIRLRLGALSGAHDILVSGEIAGASLRELVLKTLAIVPQHEGASRVNVTGPEIQLGSAAAMSVALIIHELMTNALKYGSLTVPKGRIEIQWCTKSPAGNPELHLTWKERFGPRVSSPTRRGFGSRLVRGGITGAPSTVTIDYAPEGVQCLIVADLRAVTAV